MSSFAATILQLALALLMSVQTNTTATDAQRQQAISVATQAIQLAEQSLTQNGSPVSTTAPTQTPTSIPATPSTVNSNISLFPSSGPVGTVVVLSSAFTVCGNGVSPLDCTPDRFNDYQFLQNGSVVADGAMIMGSTQNGAQEIQVPTSLAAGTYELAVQNCLGKTCTTYPIAPFTVTATASMSLTILSPVANDQWMIGSTRTITWTPITGSPTVNIDLVSGAVCNGTMMGGACTADQSIATNVPNTGSYSWIVQTPSFTGAYGYSVRVMAGTSGAVSPVFNIVTAPATNAEQNANQAKYLGE